MLPISTLIIDLNFKNMTSVLNFHLNEFQNSINDVERKLELIHSSVSEITKDYQNGI